MNLTSSRKPAILSRSIAAILVASAVLAAPSAQAANYFWDIDGATTAGAGSTTPTGTWSAGGTTWSTDSLGNTATSAYTTLSTDDLFFSAGTNATGAYTITLGASQNAKSLTFEEGTNATVTANTITLGGGGGITVNTTATTGATISSGLTINGGNRFNVGSGETLTLNTGAFTRGTRATLNVQGAGTVASSMTGLSALTNGILGPWASFGTGASTKYATISAGNIVGLTGTAAATAANVTSTAGTFNYDVAAVGTLAASASVNTLRYTGAAGTIAGALTTKGIMNASSTGGLLTLSGAVTSGAVGTEMVVNAANGNITFSGIFTGTLTKTGSGTVTLGNVANVLTTLTVNEGTLITQGTTADAITSATVNSGGTLKFGTTSDYSNTATITVNTGGILDINGITEDIGGIAGGGTITNNGAANNVRPNRAANFSGVIQDGTGVLGLIYSNSSTGTQTLTGLSTYTGQTTIAGSSSALSINSIQNVGGGASSLGAPTTVANGTIVIGNVAASGTLIYTGTGHSTDRLIQIGANSTTPANTDTGGAIIQADGASNAALTFSGTNFNAQTNAATGVGANRTLTLQGSSTGLNTISGVIRDNLVSGAGTGTATVAVTKAGIGTWVLSGASTYTGATTVNAGTLSLTGSLTGGTAISTSGTGIFNQSAAGVISGAASFVQGSSGTSILSGANTYIGATTVNAGTLDLGGSTATGSLTSSVLNLGSGTFAYTTTASVTQSFTTTNLTVGVSAVSAVSGNILNLGTIVGAGGTIDFSSTGAGTVAALTGSNVNGIIPGATFGSTWAVANGAGTAITAYSSLYTLTSVAGTTGANYTNANIEVDNSAGLLDAAITTNSLRFNTAVANTVTLATGANIVSGGILVTSAVGNNLSTITGGTLAGSPGAGLSVIQNNTSNSLTIDSVITDNGGATGLTKSGAGVLTLTGVNTFTGATAIGGGMLQIGGAGQLNSGTYANAITLSNGATLQYSSSAAQTLSGVISGSGALIKDTSSISTLTLSGANTYTGDTTVNSGTVIVANANGLGANAGSTITLNGGGLQFSTGTTQVNLNNNLVISGTGNTISTTSTLGLGILGTITGSGTLTWSPTSSTVFTAGSDMSAFSGTIIVNASGQQGFSFVQTSSTATTAGSSLAAFQFNGGDRFYLMNSANTGPGTVYMGELSGTGGHIYAKYGRPGAVTMEVGALGTTTTYSGIIGNLDVNGPADTGTTALTKVGTGTLTLSGANTYTGVTTVSGGTLKNGSATSFSNKGDLTINGGTFDLNNFAAAFVNLNATGTGGSITNSGAAVTTLTMSTTSGQGNVLVASGATLTIGDKVTISKFGTFTLGGIGPSTPTNPGGDIIINSGGTVTQTSTTNSLVINGVGTNVTVNTGGTLSMPTAGGLGQIGVGNGVGANATLTVAGGLVTSTGKNATTNYGLLVGNSGTGTVTMTSGSLTLSTAGTLVGFGNAASSTGNVFNLNGGILTADGVAVANGTAAFNIGGGTIKSTSTTGTGFTWASNANMTATVKNGGLTVDTNGSSASIAQDLLHGSGATTDSLTKNGLGTLTLSGGNTYSGGTTVNRGTLLLSGANNMPATGTLQVNAGGTFSLADGTALATTTTAALGLASGATLTFDWNAGSVDTLTSTAAATTTGTVGIMLNNTSPTGAGGTLISSASGGLTTANGTQYFLVNNTNYAATLTVTDTAVSIGAQSSVAALTDAYWLGGQVTGALGAMALSNGTSNWASDAAGTSAGGVVPGGSAVNVIFGATGAAQQADVTTGADMNLGSITFNDSAAVTIGGSNTITLNSTSPTAATSSGSGTTVIPGSAISVTSSANAANTINANLSLAANQTWNIASGKTLTVGGIVSGTGSLTKADAGTLVLSGANIYTGITTISGGTISANTVADTTSSSIGLSALANALTFGSSGGTLNFSGTGGSTKRAITFTGAGVFDIDNGKDLTVGTATATPTTTDGQWSGSGGVTKSGSGTLTVRNNSSIGSRFVVDNLRGGNFTMNGGTLNITPTRFFTIGDTSSTGTSSFSQSGGIVNFTPTTTTAGSDVYIGNAASAGQLIVTGGTFNVTPSGLQIRVGQATSGTLSIGGGAGTAMVDSPTVSVGVGAGSGIVNLYANGVLLTSALKDGTGGGTSTINFDGGTLKAKTSSGALFMPTGFDTAAITSNGLTVDTNTFDVTIGQTLSGAGGLTKSNTGTLTLSGANTYAGGTAVNQGTLTVGTGGTLGATTGPLSANNTNSTAAGTDAILNLATAVDTTVGSLSGTIATPTSGTNTATINNGGSGTNFTVNQTAAGTYAGVIAGAGNFTLGSLSTNTLTLTGANTYSGTTNVNAGKLYINGNQTSANGNVTVASTATLGGTGTIGGATTIQSGGIYSPGTSSPGTLTQANGLSISSGGIFNWNNSTVNTLGTAGTDWSVANITVGSLTLDATASTGSKLQLSFTNGSTSFADSFWNTNRTWNFITGGVSMAFDPSNISILINGSPVGSGNTVTGEGAFTTVASGSNEQLVWTPAATGYTYTTYSTVDHPGIGAASADYDNDGLNNQIEYLMGTDPTSNTNSTGAITYSIVGSPGSQHNRLVFTRPGVNNAKFPSEGTVGYKVQVSNDLVTWTSGEILIPASIGAAQSGSSGAGSYSITVANPGSSTETETVTVDDSTLTSGANQRFMRFAGSL